MIEERLRGLAYGSSLQLQAVASGVRVCRVAAEEEERIQKRGWVLCGVPFVVRRKRSRALCVCELGEREHDSDSRWACHRLNQLSSCLSILLSTGLKRNYPFHFFFLFILLLFFLS